MENDKIMRVVGSRMEADQEAFALTLRAWRIRNNLTQRQAAAAIGVSRDTILRAENCRHVSWEQLYRIFVHIQEKPV